MIALIDDTTVTCLDCHTACGHKEREHCAAAGPRPAPATIGAMLLDAEIQRATGAELQAMRDDAQAQVQRCARLAGLALAAGDDQLRRAMGHEAQAHGANVRQLDAEIAWRAWLRDFGAVFGPEWTPGTVPRAYLGSPVSWPG